MKRSIDWSTTSTREIGIVPGEPMYRLVWLLALIVFLTGCTEATLYSWGEYENQVYRSLSAGSKSTPEMQVAMLESDVRKARATKKRLPPGFHAHLGYLYFQLGNLERARQELELEKSEFRESAVFMDRLLASVKKR